MQHAIFFHSSQNMSEIANETIDLVVTSPPYPMIEMWDDIMSRQNKEIEIALKANNPQKAFKLMHNEIKKVWAECYRVLKNGAFLCINIGDATRTIDKHFALYPNCSKVISTCNDLGFTCLPNILWRKQTNAPNKFMGSGMLPCGAYMTLEHEWILIFRKGEKRVYRSTKDKEERRKSSFFWEERNVWFSDVWEIKGTKQDIPYSLSRERNASYPIEIPLRLINMFSQKGDTVLDPFAGLCTTNIAAIMCERNSIAYEIDPLLKPIIKDRIESINIEKVNNTIYGRYINHLKFIEERIKQNKEPKYENLYFNCKVVTRQETDITFNYLKQITPHHEEKMLNFNSEYYFQKKFSAPPSNNLFNESL